MKKISLALSLVLSWAMTTIVEGQGIDPSPKLEKLVVNSSPAFILLGVQPDNIQRPSTPRAFMGGLQSAMVNRQLQPNFGLETNPFAWGRDTFSNQFYANDYFYSAKESIKKNFAVSLATSTSDTVVFGKLKPGLGLGYGLRVTLLPGRVNAAITEKYLEWEKEEIKSIFLDLLDSQHDLGRKSFSDGELDRYYAQITASIDKGYIINGRNERKYILGTNRQKVLKELKDLVDSYKGLKEAEFEKRLPKEIDTLMKYKNLAADFINNSTVGFDREGFTLELAAAGVTVFQNNKWDDSHGGKGAIWLTPSYRINVKGKKANEFTRTVDLMGVFRYMWNNKFVDTASYLDFGGKFQYNKPQWNASFEFVARHASKVPASVRSNWTNCWLFSFNYTLLESATLKFSFGSNFDGNTKVYTQRKDMFVVGGVNLGIF